jgi:5'-phosphate synthase pdxT subunit
MKVGVLALQGDFAEHIAVFRQIGAETRAVRLPDELEGLDGLVIPGGESTTIGKLATAYELADPIRAMARTGRPIWGTCAGLIFLAREAVDGVPGQTLLGLMDIAVVRNGFGRQLDSFEADLDIAVLGPPPLRGVFIRAPYVHKWGAGVKVLARLEGGQVVAVQEGNLLGTAFHPELTDDERLHRYFLRIAEKTALGQAEAAAPTTFQGKRPKSAETTGGCR